MRVSVVIPCYNSAAFIGEALASALAQTMPPAEIIVVDDGSTDASAKAVMAFAPKVKLITQANGGPSVARNRGIAASTGELIAFLDADDRWLPEKLERQIPFFSDSEMGLVCSGYAMLGQRHNEALHSGPVTFHDLLRSNRVGTLTAVASKAAIDRVGGFDETMGAAKGPCEDWDLWIRISAHFKVHCVPEVLAEYRVHPGGASRHARRLFDCELRVIEKNSRLHPACKECESAVQAGRKKARRGYGANLAGEARLALADGRYGIAVKLAAGAMWHDPSSALRMTSRILGRSQ